ncbi:MAG: MFS transporter, partial [bacterium]
MNTFQPKGYLPLFLIFMFERMYFYGIRALLVLFMIKHLMFSMDKASNYYGWYLAALSFSPILGGLISDIWLGRKKALLWSIIVAIFGCVLLAISSLASSALLFYAATFLIVVGAMLFRPTIYTTLSNIYDSGHDPRRDGGFTLILLAINLGAFFAPLVCGTLGERFGWWSGFLTASIFMIAVLFLLKHVTTNIDLKASSPEPSSKNILFITLLVILAVYLPYHLASNSIDMANFTGAIIGGMSIPSSWIQSLMLLPSFIFYLIFPWLWIKLARINKEPSTIYKFVWGLAFLLLALLVYNFVVVRYV